MSKNKGGVAVRSLVFFVVLMFVSCQENYVRPDMEVYQLKGKVASFVETQEMVEGDGLKVEQHYIFNGLGTLSQITNVIVNSAGDKFNESRKTIYEYEGNSRLVRVEYPKLTFTDGEERWVSANKLVFSHTSNGITTKIEKEFNADGKLFRTCNIVESDVLNYQKTLTYYFNLKNSPRLASGSEYHVSDSVYFEKV